MDPSRTMTISTSEYSLSSSDSPQNLAIGYGVDLPFGHGKQFLGDAQGVLGGIVSGGGSTELRRSGAESQSPCRSSLQGRLLAS